MSHSQADTLASRSRQASSGSLRLPRCALRGRVGFRPTSEFGVRHGHPPLHGVVFFTDQVLSQIDLLRYWMETTAYRNGVQLLPKELDGKVATLRLPALGAGLTVLTREQLVKLCVHGLMGTLW